MNPILSLPAKLVLAACFLGAAACERKEKVIDINTPDGGIEVLRDKDTGEVEIQVDSRENR